MDFLNLFFHSCSLQPQNWRRMWTFESVVTPSILQAAMEVHHQKVKSNMKMTDSKWH